MIEKLLEAYETEVVKNNLPLVKRIKRMRLGRKIILFVNIALMIAILFFAFFQIKTAVCISLLLIAILYFETILFENIRHKKWKENIEEYNRELDNIAKILKREEFNLYDKMKIKQLIRKFYQKIAYETQEDSNKKEEKKGFIFSYIIPVITFFAGSINVKSMVSDSDIVVMCVLIILTIALARYDYVNTADLIKRLKWNTIEKGKEFVPKLQDLLDRDFAIAPEDLISIK
ncbi:MAG: hypothetical protein HDR02_16985 [Lachnospiraceae bacterium]|nr:hypothetical protein [Lachnospiraceae bacterium]